MPLPSPFSVDIKPDWKGLLNSITRLDEPKRVHNIELFLDPEVQQAVCDRYGVGADLDPADPHYAKKRLIAVHAYLGYDFLRCGAENIDMPMVYHQADDTAELARDGGRAYLDENVGPITTWEEFEKYPWPSPDQVVATSLEWYDKNLPEGMCILAGGGFGHFCEHITWLMGYTTFCEALYEKRDLIKAIFDRVLAINIKAAELMVQFDCVKALWGSDDMGYKGGPLMSPDDLREFVFPGHRFMANIAHRAGRPYLLHSCGNLALVMDDLIDNVGIDAKHSFEDTIERVTEVKHTYGQRVALLGGIDVDFLCRSSEADVRRRTRETLGICMPGGGYCLGTGNSVANYIPLDNYLAMLDEGRKFGQ
jgi:uroporphyrinogen decarboxylase